MYEQDVCQSTETHIVMLDLQQHAEAVKRTQALRQKLNGRLNQAMSPVKPSAPAPSRSLHAASGQPQTSSAAPSGGPASSSASTIQTQLPANDEVDLSAQLQPTSVPTIDQPTGETMPSRTANGFPAAVPTSPRRQRESWPELPGTTAAAEAPTQPATDAHLQQGRVGGAGEAAGGVNQELRPGGSATSPVSPSQRSVLGRRLQPSTSMRECMTSLTPSSPNSRLFLTRRT